MILSLLDIIENTGKTMTVPVRPSFTGVTVNGKTFPVTIASAAVFTITNTGKKVLSVEAEGTVTATIPCDRCLKEVQVQIPWKVEQKLDCRLTEEDRQQSLSLHRSWQQRPVCIATLQHGIRRPVCRDNYPIDAVLILQ